MKQKYYITIIAAIIFFGFIANAAWKAYEESLRPFKIIDFRFTERYTIVSIQYTGSEPLYHPVKVSGMLTNEYAIIQMWRKGEVWEFFFRRDETGILIEWNGNVQRLALV